MLPHKFKNAIQPFESKFTVPTNRINITDTPFTVKSLGFNTTFYTWDDTTSAADFTGLTNITEINSGVQALGGFYSGNGGQPISYRAGEAVAIEYTGWFYTELNSGATAFDFSMLGANGGKLTLIVNGSTKISSQTVDQFVRIEGTTQALASAGTWQSITIRYWSAQLEKGFCAFWRDDVEQVWMPLSAGVVNTVPGFESSVELDYILNTSSLESRNDLKQYSFEIPIIESSSITDDGYYFNRDSQQYIDINDATKTLKKHQLIEAEVGFKKDQHVYYFDGIGSRCFILNTSVTADMQMDSDDLIFSCWSKAESEVADIAYLFRWKSADAGFRIWYNTTGTGLDYQIEDDGANTVADTFDAATNYADGQWHHYVFGIQRSDGILTIAIDGEIKEEIDISTLTGSLHDAAEHIFYAGSGGSNGFTNGGRMSEMMYFNLGVGELTDDILDSSIKDLYDRPNKLPDVLTTTQLIWRLAGVNETTIVNPTTLTDLTSNGNDFTRSGSIIVENNDSYLPYGLITSDSNYDDYIKLFIGHIKSFEISRKIDGKDIINVRCESFESLLKEQINLNYPDKFDYWTQSFAGNYENASRPNSLTFPPTFDAFPIEASVRALMIRGYIDPTLLYKRRQFLNNAGTIVEADRLLESSNPVLQLERGKDYGNPGIFYTTSKIDNEYRLKSNFGDKLFDYIQNITEQYGWEFGSLGFYDGAFFLRTRNNPTDIHTMETGAPTFNGTWGTAVEYDLQAISGTYRQTGTTDDYVEWSVFGERVDVIMGMRNDIGGGTLCYVLSSSSTSQSIFRDITGQALAVDQVMVVELPTGNVDITLLTNPSGNTWTFRGSLTEPIPADVRVRSASSKVELVRGSSYDSANIVATAFLPTYMEGGQKDIISKSGVSGVFGEEVDNSPQVVGSLRFYYDGFDPETADNPCQFRIGSGLTRDEHILRITQLSGTGYTTVNCVYTFDRDAMNPQHDFYTGDVVATGTLIDLSVKDSGEDIRNDVTVVGMKLGTYTPGDAVQGAVANPNNPTNKYVISRAIDTRSIINSGTDNFVGRPIQTILIEPGIGTLQRADYWAVNFLNEFRNSEKVGRFEALGHPLLEVGDAIRIDDEAKDTIDTSNVVWIEQLTQSWSKGIARTVFDVSSSPPAASYEAKIPVELDNFGTEVVNNITVSSNATDSGTPYDPYDSDAVPAEFIEITFDLVLDGWLSIAVYGEDENTNAIVKVAELLNATGDENQKGTRWMTAGTDFKVIWDGVDQIGDWNARYLKATNNTSDGANFFASLPTDFNGDATSTYSKFYMVFTLKTLNRRTYKVNTKADLDPQVFMYTAPGAVVSPSFSVAGAGGGFVAGTSTDKPTGFLSSDFSNRGANIQFNTDKPAMVYIRVKDFDWHAALPKDFPQDGRTGEPIPSESVTPLEFNDDGKYYENTEFIDYATTNLYMHPEHDLGTFQNDWEVNVGQRKFNESTTDFFEGHYFYFEAFFTDKSGRTVKETAVAWWDLSGGKAESLGYGIHYLPDDNLTNGEINIGIVWGVAPA